jgi:MraZ protein
MKPSNPNLYIGKYFHSIDGKNRLFLPANFRGGRNEVFVCAQGLEGCLYVYAKQSWQRVLEKLENLSVADKIEERAFKRAFLSGAFEVSADLQGRVLIPQHLRDYAKIKNEAAVIGVGTRIEVWDRKIWEAYYKDQADFSFKNMASKLEL